MGAVNYDYEEQFENGVTVEIEMEPEEVADYIVDQMFEFGVVPRKLEIVDSRVGAKIDLTITEWVTPAQLKRLDESIELFQDMSLEQVDYIVKVVLC